MASDSGDVMTIGELAEYLKASKSTSHELAQEGSLPGQKSGKRWRFHRDVIDRWLTSHPPRRQFRRYHRLSTFARVTSTRGTSSATVTGRQRFCTPQES